MASNNNLFNKCLLILLSGLYSSIIHGATGLHYSDGEIKIWRERAGLDAGSRIYYLKGDVQENSPGDWLRIWTDADSAMTRPGNDRYTNYDTSQGLDNPVTELHSSWLPDSSYPARIPYIDAKEPRPGIDRQDFAAISTMNAGLAYLLLGDEGQLGNYSGFQYADAVRNELIWYAENEWLDFSNEKRWVPSLGGFGDRNPGFFIACWLNTLVNAYDYTRSSSAYSVEDHEIIMKWFFDAVEFYHKLKLAGISFAFPNYSEWDYGTIGTSHWNDNQNDPAWEGSEFVSFGLNEQFSNRSTTQWRFIMRGGLLLKDHPLYGEGAREAVRSAHRWMKDWILFGTFRDGTYSDFHRGSVEQPQQGLSYSSIAIGAAVDMADAYERQWYREPDFESLYEWTIYPGSADFQLMAPDSLKERPFYDSFIPVGNEVQGLKQVLRTYGQYFDESYGSIRAWGGVPIDGHSGGWNVDNLNRWIAPACNYFVATDPELGNYLKSIYTHSAPGMLPYTSSVTRAGSYIVDIGSWAGHPGTLFMFGLMEGKVWPYSPALDPANPFREETISTGGWKESSWFGWLQDLDFPSVFHLEHGWIYVWPGSTVQNLYCYDASLGWMWTNQSTYPFLYQFGESRWIYYLENSTDPRWFWSLNEGNWFSNP